MQGKRRRLRLGKRLRTWLRRAGPFAALATVFTSERGGIIEIRWIVGPIPRGDLRLARQRAGPARLSPVDEQPTIGFDRDEYDPEENWWTGRQGL
jgi:hypothetical protein